MTPEKLDGFISPLPARWKTTRSSVCRSCCGSAFALWQIYGGTFTSLLDNVQQSEEGKTKKKKREGGEEKEQEETERRSKTEGDREKVLWGSCIRSSD